MKKKILLLSPNADGLADKLAYPPLGLLYVAANLPKDTWEPEVRVLLDDDFRDYSYEYYGISVHSLAVYKKSKELIDKILFQNYNAQIYVGGSAASLFENNKNVAVYLGQFENYMSIGNLDDIKFPARHLLPYGHIHYTGKVHHSEKPSTTMIATRGCAYNCAFCDRTTLGRLFRKRSPDNVMEEIELLKKDYKIEHIRFIDDCLTLDRKWFNLFLDMMFYRNVTWTCLSRADLLDMEVLARMRLCGCKEVFFGFESGSQKMLDLMNKKTSVEKNKKAIEMCKAVGMKCCAYMMFGFPGENADTVNETLRFLDETKPDKSRISTFVPVPNTAVWNHPEKYNVSINKNYEDFWYYDNDRLGLKYNYIQQGEMEKLRVKVINYYKENFVESWTK